MLDLWMNSVNPVHPPLNGRRIVSKNHKTMAAQKIQPGRLGHRVSVWPFTMSIKQAQYWVLMMKISSGLLQWHKAG
jgi:hypothetical protein